MNSTKTPSLFLTLTLSRLG